jgi:hypothetical protein
MAVSKPRVKNWLRILELVIQGRTLNRPWGKSEEREKARKPIGEGGDPVWQRVWKGYLGRGRRKEQKWPF